MSLEKATRTRLATVLILLLVLLTGSVLGIALDRRLESRAVASEGGPSGEATAGERTGRGGEAATPSPGRRRLIVEQVGLTDVQKTRVDSIVSHYRQQMRDLQEELQKELETAYTPRYRSLLEETRSEIKGVLTSEQRLVYDSLLAEHDRRRAERRARDSISDSGG